MPRLDPNPDGFADWPHPEFITRYDPPPIPTRFFDWSAVSENYEPGMPIGHGVSEEDAVTHLLDQMEDGL
jgi:hypothetical protein